MPKFKLTFFKTCALSSTLLLTAFFATAFLLNPADDYIELQSQRLSVTPKEFYVSHVDDERTDKAVIGKIISANSAAVKQAKYINIDFKAGAAASVKAFIDNSFTANKNLRPIFIKLKKLDIVETSNAAGRADGRITLQIVFGYERDEDFIKLGDYGTVSTYQRTAGPARQVEPLLRNALFNALIYLDNWMNKQADTNIKLARSVKVSFTNHTEHVEGDTIYYDVARPLKWSDFQQKPQNSRYAAEVFASLGYNETVKVNNGIINIMLDIKVYLPKSACWARYDAMTASNLVHEQHHFDIVKIVGEHFKRNILAEKLSTHNYDGAINMAYFDALREINTLQKQYDKETAHSTNVYQQQLWNARIERELQQLNIVNAPAP